MLTPPFHGCCLCGMCRSEGYSAKKSAMGWVWSCVHECIYGNTCPSPEPWMWTPKHCCIRPTQSSSSFTPLNHQFLTLSLMGMYLRFCTCFFLQYTEFSYLFLNTTLSFSASYLDFVPISLGAFKMSYGVQLSSLWIQVLYDSAQLIY